MSRRFWILILVFIISLSGVEAKLKYKKVTLPELDISSMPQLETILKDVLSDCKLVNRKFVIKKPRTFSLKIRRKENGYKIFISLSDDAITTYYYLKKMLGYIKIDDDYVILKEGEVFFKKKSGRRNFYFLDEEFMEEAGLDNGIDWEYFITDDSDDPDNEIKKISFDSVV